MKHGIWVLAGLALAAVAAPAAGDTAETANKRSARRIALADALSAAVRQNPALEKARIDTAIADQQFLEAAGVDDWVLSANGTVSFDKRENSGDNPFRAESSVSGGVDMSRSLRGGGRVSVGFSSRAATQNVFGFDEALDENGDPVLVNGEPLIITTQEEVLFFNLGISASFTQPLLRGYGSAVARAAERQASVAKEASVISGEVVAIDMVTQIVTAYWELAYAHEELDIRKASLALAQEQLRITRAGIEAGSVARTESLAIEQGIAVREEAILVAEVNVAEKSLALRRLVGMEIGPGEIGLATADPVTIDDRDFDLDAALTKVEDHNPQLALLKSNGEGAKITLEITRDGVRPSLDVTVAGGPSGASDDIGDAFEQIALFKSWNVQVSAVYTKTLGNRAAEAAVRSAELEQRKILVSYEELKRELSVQLVLAVNSVRAGRKRIEVTTKSIELSQQNLATERARFEAGDATNFDILQRQNELEQAMLAKSRATVDFLNAVTTVEALTGDLLGRYGISIDGATHR